MRVLRRLIVALVCASASACIDNDRINSTCAWSDRVSGALDLGKAEDREHLRQDAQVEWELAVRYSDTRFRHDPSGARPLRRECRGAIDDSIMARHGVTAQEIQTARNGRVWWADVLFVILPMIGLTILATEPILRHISGALGVDWRGGTTTSRILFVAIAAIVATGVTQCWAMAVETVRLRDGHIADRVTVLPSVAHSGITFAVAFVICAISMVLWRRGDAKLATHR